MKDGGQGVTIGHGLDLVVDDEDDETDADDDADDALDESDSVADGGLIGSRLFFFLGVVNDSSQSLLRMFCSNCFISLIFLISSCNFFNT